MIKLLIRVGLGMGFFRDPESQIPIPGIPNRDFLFWAISKNPEIPKSSGSGSGLKLLRSPEIFYLRDRDFFSWDGISRQKATSAIYNGKCIENEQKKGSNRFDRCFCKSTFCMQECDEKIKLNNLILCY